jgi:uncharacterized protein (DUF1499 family)
MEPLSFSGKPESAMQAIKRSLATIPRAKIVSETGNYLHAECRSLVFGFVDDVEFYFDEPGSLIQFRSASRVGYSDLGKNRARMTAFCKTFLEQNRPSGVNTGY